MRVIETASPEETIAAGEQLAMLLPRGAPTLLIGELGAGKTTFAKGVARGLGAAGEDEVSSPTFTLIHEFGDGLLFHIDLYRLDTWDEVRRLGLEELFDRNGVVLIEWGERFPELLALPHAEIRFKADDDHRRITVAGLDD